MNSMPGRRNVLKHVVAQRGSPNRAVLTVALILSHLLITCAPALLLAATIYTTYVAIRLHMPLRLEFPFYTPRIQF